MSDRAGTVPSVARCTAVLADAFGDDPWARYIVGGRPRPRALAGLFRVPVATAEGHGGLVTVGRDAVSTWLPVHARRLSAAMVVRSGALLLPFLVGLRTLRRQLADEAELDDVIDRYARPGDAYLWVLGVRRAAHGQGLGRAAVEATARAAATRGHDRLLLTTDNPGNVTLYEHLGFTRHGSHERASGFTAHVMVRPLALRRPSGPAATDRPSPAQLGG